jgi:SAM-dependent methyltransferase
MDDNHGTPLVDPNIAAKLGLDGLTLEGELTRVMGLLTAAGVEYPPGYREILICKYKTCKELMLYPHNLVRAGDPGIRQHRHYPDILQRGGSLLDFGCGIGDDVRALVADGYPLQNITAFDINWNSINLGFDLYLDKKLWINRFIVAKQSPFPPPYFDTIYSGNVIHVLFSKKAIRNYIANAHAALNPGGIFLGSTLGGSADHPRFFGKKLLMREELQAVLCDMGFSNIEINEADYKGNLKF